MCLWKFARMGCFFLPWSHWLAVMTSRVSLEFKIQWRLSKRVYLCISCKVGAFVAQSFLNYIDVSCHEIIVAQKLPRIGSAFCRRFVEIQMHIEGSRNVKVLCWDSVNEACKGLDLWNCSSLGKSGIVRSDLIRDRLMLSFLAEDEWLWPYRRLNG